MNGYILGNGRYLAAETGADTSKGGKGFRVLDNPAAFTDLWGERDAVLADLQGRGAYIVNKPDVFAASILTGNGRTFYHDKDRSPWQPPTGMTAAATMLLLDKLAATMKRYALQYNPAYRGISILAATRERHGDWFQYEELPETVSMDPTPNFTVKVPYDRAKCWLHVYDMRAAWLSSARTAPTGYGARQMVKGFDPNREGLWMCRPAAGTPPYSPITRPGWYPTAIARAAVDNYGLSIHMGWCWQFQATALRSLSENLIAARSESLALGRDTAEREWLVESIKKVYTRTFGKLQKGETGRPWSKQPHWYLSLRAESARRMWRVYTANPDCIGFDADAAFILTANPDPRAAFSGSKVPLSPHSFNPGSWKYEGSYPTDRAMFELFGGRGATLAEYLRGRESVNLWKGGE